MKLASISVKQKIIKIDRGRIAMHRPYILQFIRRLRRAGGLFGGPAVGEVPKGVWPLAGDADGGRYSPSELIRSIWESRPQGKVSKGGLAPLCGIINLNKPRGPQCKQLVPKIKILLGVNKTGHAGTLDPNTTGVLPILIGKATKLSEILSKSDKIYRGKFKLHGEIPRKKLERSISKFIGTITQLPPKLSAVKRVPREREIYWFKLFSYKNRIASFEVACQHGTYIRKLCHDLGEQLGVGAHMFELERIQSGPFKLRKAVSIDKVYKLAKKKKYNKFISPPEAAIKYIPKVWIDNDVVRTVKQGTPVFAPGVLRITSDFAPEKTVAILGQDNKLKALGVAKMTIAHLKTNPKGIATKTDLVLI